MVCVDVGAHQGSWTFPLSDAVGDAGFVYAFEPSPEYSGSLLSVINRSQATNVACVPVALSDSVGFADFVIHDQRGNRLAGESRLAAANDLAERKVVTTTLDTAATLLPRLGDVRFIKIDVEGLELRVLRGGHELLRANKPLLYLEIEDRHCRRFGWSKDSVFAYLRELGYADKQLDRNNFIFVAVDP
jgi:FkbM family methyltransferase